MGSGLREFVIGFVLVAVLVLLLVIGAGTLVGVAVYAAVETFLWLL